MTRRITSLVTIGCLLAFAAVSRAADDKKFAMNAAAAGEVEVSLGKFAAGKATNDDVKKFAQRMVDDHSKINDELKSIAQSKNIDLAKAQEKAMKKAEEEEKKLGKKEGAAFDKDYMKMMVADHEKDVKEFEEVSKHGEDSELKAFATKHLPMLQEHLTMAKDIESKLAK